MERVDADMRANRREMRLSDLADFDLPDYGDSTKIGLLRGLPDSRLLEAINNPDELGSVITIQDGEATQGNHRIGEALRRMHDPRHAGITPDTISLVP